MSNTPDLRVLNLGAGVQSSTLALMIAAGEIPNVDVAIFADTQWEPSEVYDQLDWLEPRVPFPIRRVTAGDLRSDALNPERKFISMPVFLVDDNNSSKLSQGRRQCTREYKIAPIEKAIRSELGVKTLSGLVVEQVYGISYDEVGRMKDPRRNWERFDYPLVDRRMTRADCRRWMRDNGYPEPPRSACIGCPYRSNEEWRHLKMTDSAAFNDAIDFDAALRADGASSHITGHAYVHSQRIPLELVDLRNEEDRGQLSWLSECEGMCGL